MKRRLFLFGLTFLALCSQAFGASTWAHVSDGTWVSATNATISVAWGSHSSGDDAFLIVSLGTSNATTIDTPSGWTLEQTNDYNTGSDIVAIFSREATSGAEANVTVTPSTLFSGDIIAGFITVYSGGSFTKSGSPTTASNSSADFIPYTTMTPLVANTLVLMAVSWGDVTPGWDPNDAETGWIKGEEGDSAAGADTGTGLYYQIQGIATATGTGTITTSNELASATTGSIVIAFEDEVGGGGGGGGGTWTHISDGTVVFLKEAPIIIAWPSHATDDIGILVVALQHNLGPTTPTPSGWTLLDDYDVGDGQDISVFGRIATSGAESDVTITMVGFETDDVHGGAISVFRGGTLTLTDAAGHDDAFGTTDVPFAAHSPSIDNKLVLIAIGGGDIDANSLTNPSGFTEGFYDEHQPGYSVFVSLKWWIQTTATAISAGNMTAENNTPSNSTIFSLEAGAGAGTTLARRRR